MNRLGDVVSEDKIVKFAPGPHKSIYEIDEMSELISEPQWPKENPLIIKGGKVEVTLVDYEPLKSCTNSLAISTCLKCGKCGRTFHAGKLTDDKVFKRKISYSNKTAILYPMNGGADK